MKKLLLSLLIVLVLALSACSMTGFAPWQNTDSNESDVILNDTFNVVDVPVDKENESGNISLDDVETSDSDDELEVKDTIDDAESLILTTLEAVEGDLVSLADLLAEDPDGDSISYEYSAPFNARGLWQTNDGDEGKYLAEITATDGSLSTTEQVRVIITPSNKAPVIDCPSDVAVFEGELIDLSCVIYDKEGDKVSYAVTGFMSDLTYQTTFDDAGEYVVIVTANDGSKTSVKEISLIIANQNQKPFVSDISLIEVLEGQDVDLVVDAFDEDGDDLTITYPDRFDKNGVWTTSRGDAGTYEFEIEVSDGIDVVLLPVKVVVGKVNVAPIIDPIDTIEVKEGDLITLPIKVLDEDGDDLTIDITGFMTSETYQTTFDDAGKYTVTISVSDAKHTVSLDVSVIITEVNRPPVFIVK